MKLKRYALYSGVALGALLLADYGLSGPGTAPYSSYISRSLVGIVDQVSTILCTEGQACQVRATPYGAITVTPIDLSGNVITGGGGGGSGGDVNLTQIKGVAVDSNTGAASAATLRVVPATGSSVAATQSGTWTVQPGNTANTTPWLMDSELPAAAALADAAANPTVPGTGAFGLIWNGTTWDRQPGTVAAGTLSDTEMPAAAALATGMSNPTAPAVGAFGLMWNGTNWDRVGGSAAAGVTVNSELPAAASITDNLAVSTTTTAAALGMVYDGSNWDRLPGNSATGALVSLGAAIPAGTNNIGYTIPGHSATISRESTIANSDGAQTNATLVGTIATGTCIELYEIDATTNSTTAVGVRIGFGASAVPTAALAGVNGVVLSHPGITTNSGMVKGMGLLATGASGEELRITTTAAPSSGAFFVVTFSYRTISC